MGLEKFATSADLRHPEEDNLTKEIDNQKIM